MAVSGCGELLENLCIRITKRDRELLERICKARLEDPSDFGGRAVKIGRVWHLKETGCNEALVFRRRQMM